MRIVGSLSRSAFEPDPTKAWRRARVLDAWLRSASRPGPRGVTRATHAVLARQDEARMIDVAATINRR
jgi:hypothetical protein